MIKSKEFHAFTLGCLAVFHFLLFPAFGRPRPPLPPLPAFAPLLSRFDFDEPYWQGTNTPTVETEDGQLIESWSGYAFVRSGVMLKAFVIPAIDSGRTNLAADSGAVRFWFKPYWTSASLTNGTGPGTEATLLDLIVVGDNDIITAWSLRFSADGATLILSEGATELLTADVAWPAGEWHCLALNYGPNETAMFLDGDLIGKGEGVANVPASSAGLVVGSTAFGTGAADGEFDEVCAFARPLQEFDVSMYALSYSTIAARGSISAEEEEAAAKRRSEQETMMEMMRAQPTGGTANCPTNVAVFITNLVATVTTNDGVTVTFDILGGTNGVLYDIFSATNLLDGSITNST